MIVNLLLFLLGASMGPTFPDIDLAPPLFMRHRSFWTHGIFVPLVIYLLRPSGAGVYFAFPFLIGVAVHLLHDMFPKSWQGGALINKMDPIRITFPRAMSFLWITAGMFSAVWVFWPLYGWIVISFLNRWVLPLIQIPLAFLEGLF